MKRRRSDRARPVCTESLENFLRRIAHLTIRGES